MLGPSGLSNISIVSKFFNQNTGVDFYEVLGLFCRIIFLFLIGLETDIPYIRRNNICVVCCIAYGGAMFGIIFGLAASTFLSHQLELEDQMPMFMYILSLLFAYTASPVVIRLAAELKFDTSNIGRLAISSSLINEMSCLLFFNLIIAFHSKTAFKFGFYCAIADVVTVLIIKYLANWFNKRNHNQKYLKNPELFVILSLVIGNAMYVEWASFNSMISCFVIGLLFPKEGKSARTLLHKLTFLVHNFLLPIYFGYIGFQFNGKYLNSWKNILIVVVMVLLSIGCKISGTLASCHYLKIPLNEGVLLGFLMTLKGHVDLLFIGSSSKELMVSFSKSKSFIHHMSNYSVVSGYNDIILLHFT